MIFITVKASYIVLPLTTVVKQKPAHRHPTPGACAHFQRAGGTEKASPLRQMLS